MTEILCLVDGHASARALLGGAGGKKRDACAPEGASEAACASRVGTGVSKAPPRVGGRHVGGSGGPGSRRLVDGASRGGM